MLVIDRVNAMNDVELDAAFAIFYAVGAPMGALESDGNEGGVVQWAQKNYPSEYAMLSAAFRGCITGTLNAMEQRYGASKEP